MKLLVIAIVTGSIFTAYGLIAQNPPYAPIGGDLTTMNQGEGLIVFASNREGPPWDLWIIRSDGAFARNLTNTPRISESVPGVSLNGRRIAYRTCVAGNCGLEIRNIDGTGQRNIVPRGRGYNVRRLTWLPDSYRVIFENSADDKLYLVNTKPGGGNPVLLERSSPGRALDWFPAAGSGTMVEIKATSENWSDTGNLVIDGRNHAWVYIRPKVDDPACTEQGVASSCGLESFPLAIHLTRNPTCTVHLDSSPVYISPDFFENAGERDCWTGETSFIGFSLGETNRSGSSGSYQVIVVPVPCYNDRTDCR